MVPSFPIEFRLPSSPSAIQPLSLSSFKSHPSKPRFSSRKALILFSFVVTLSLVSAQQQTALSLTFQDENGTPLGQPQSISLAECTPITFVSPDAGADDYTSVVSSDIYAALNLYSDPQCQVLESATVGMWNNTAPVAGITGIRWVGPAPASDPPGKLTPTGYSSSTPSSPGTSGSEVPDRFVLDPSKGRAVVALISAVLAIGVIVGVYQVYQAAQYAPPPKKPKKKAVEGGGVVGAKKIRKKEAYYKKPIKEKEFNAAGAGVGFGTSSISENRSHSMLLSPPLQDQSRQDRYSFASTFSANASTFVATRSTPPTSAYYSSGLGGVDAGVGVGPMHHGREDLLGSDSVLIDIQSDPFISPSSTITPEFGNDSLYNTMYSASSSSPLPSGRSGEVLAPMHQLDSRQSSTRRTGRSP
ncbi:hypothetical protein BGX27_011193 [Mortierella sp. AM989]|nr:hypothetical protein BGX27_011193 [Mortierella sp. AM989]